MMNQCDEKKRSDVTPGWMEMIKQLRSTLAHPGEPGTPASIALTLGGTVLFLAGHALFKQAVFDEPPWPQLVAILLLATLVPVGLAAPTLALAAAVGLVLVGLAGWETLSRRSHHRRQQRPRR